MELPLAIAVLAGYAGCYLDRVPVTDRVARASTYRIVVQMPDESMRQGLAWSINAEHLVTAGWLCEGAENIAVLDDKARVHPTLVELVSDRLCLIAAPHELAAGPPILFANTQLRWTHHLAAPGSPLWGKWGVVGVVLAVDSSGRARQAVSLAALTKWAHDHRVDFTTSIPPDELDMDITCQGPAKAQGMCSEFDPHSIERSFQW